MSVNNPQLHSVYLDNDLNHKFLVIFNVKKRFFDKKTTESGIIKQAIAEYIENHKEEINKMMEEYHKHGGCMEL